MPGITFVFGPNGSFFFDSQQVWKFDRLPGTLRQLFTSSMTPAWRIAQPYCVALAPQINSPEPLWYVGCKVMTGEDKLFYSQTYFENNYADLCRWTRTFPTVSSSCFVTFGLNLSYFASAPGRGSIWAGIPSDLEDKLRKSFETPCCVSLGMHNSWFVLWPDGNCSWKLNGYYDTLEKILSEAAPRSISYVAISPYSERQYFITFKDQSIKYDFTGAPPEWMKLMTEAFDVLTTARFQTPQQQYVMPNSIPYPQAQLHSALHPQHQAAYYYNSTIAELPSDQPYSIPVSPSLSPNAPFTGHSDPNSSQTAPSNAHTYRPSRQDATQIPVELPDNTPLAATAHVSIATASMEKKKKRFLSRFF